MMRKLDLKEYATSEHTLSVAERDALQETVPSLTVQPVMGTEGVYQLMPGSTVGAVEIGDLSVLIEPKIPIPQLLSLVCYAMGTYKPQREMFDYPREYALPDMLALSLASAARRAFSRGLLHGYRVEEDALHTVRGRIRFDQQIRRRFAIALPVEVRYDEFTDDILANQLVKAAATRLGGMRLHSQAARRELGLVAGTLDNVSPVEFLPNSVPEVRFDRLNGYYREVVALSRLVLQHSAFESRRGEVRASGFLMDMNVVFQEFVTQALREALVASNYTFCSAKQLKGNRRIYLDGATLVKLEPDLTWWQSGACLFVGDAKYKKIEVQHAPNTDLYQMLAYTTALDLPGGMLIYAEGEAKPMVHEVRHSRKRLEIAALDLSGTLEEVLNRVHNLACKVKTSCETSETLVDVAQSD